MQNGIKAGRLFQGTLSVNRYNPFEGWVTRYSADQVQPSPSHRRRPLWRWRRLRTHAYRARHVGGSARGPSCEAPALLEPQRGGQRSVSLPSVVALPAVDAGLCRGDDLHDACSRATSLHAVRQPASWLLPPSLPASANCRGSCAGVLYMRNTTQIPSALVLQLVQRLCLLWLL